MGISASLRKRPRGALLTASLLALGCGGGGDGAPDGSADGSGSDARASDAGAPIPSPERASRPAFGPCPAGHRLVHGVLYDHCDPWPEGGPEDCDEAEAHFPGEPGCTPIGTACPSSGWATDLPSDRPVLYVSAAASPAGGDGSEADPHGSLARAAASAAAGAIVALDAGRYDEPLSVTFGAITLWGACVSGTVLGSSDPDPNRGVVDASGGDVTVRNLRITGAGHGVIAGPAAAEVVLAQVQIDDTWVHAVAGLGEGVLRLEDVVVRDARPGTVAEVPGRGAAVSGGASLELSRVAIERVYDLAVRVGGEGSTLDAADVAVRQIRPRAHDGMHGRAVEVLDGADAALDRVAIESARDVAVLVGARAEVAISGSMVRDTGESEATGLGGRALEVKEGGTLSVERTLVEGAREVSVLVSSAALRMADGAVRDTRPRAADDSRGRGIIVQERADATLERVWLERNHEVGVLVTADSTASLMDAAVLGTEADVSTGLGGSGIAVQFGSSATVLRALFDGNRVQGVAVFGPDASFDATDVAILNTRSLPDSGLAGRGLGAQEGATVTLLRALVKDNREAGIVAFHAGTTVSLTEAIVAETSLPACAPGSCPAVATGLAALLEAHVEADGFLIVDDEVTGVLLALGGTMDLRNGTIEGHPIGAGVQTAGFDITRLTEGVVYLDNEVNLDSSELPVPEPSVAVAVAD